MGRSALRPAGDPAALLSARELALLRMMADGFSDAEIAAGLNLGAAAFASLRGRLADSLGLPGGADIAAYAQARFLQEAR